MDNMNQLPVVNVGKHTLTLPSTGEKIKYRPYIVKEEKILLMAIESEDTEQMLDGFKTVVDNCTFGKLEVDKLPTIDLEWIFLQMRMKSKGETSTVGFRCKAPTAYQVDKIVNKTIPCGHVNKFDIDLNTIDIINDPLLLNKARVITIIDDIGVKMKFPSLDWLSKQKEDIKTVDDNMALLADSIEMIFQGDDVFNADDFGTEKVIAFLDQFTEQQLEKIKNFFENHIPQLHKTLDYECEKCGHKEKLELKGMRSFFG